MKKTISALVACALIAGVSFISCKKNDEKDLRSRLEPKENFLQGYVFNKKNMMVLWFQVYDHKDGKSTFDRLPNKIEKIDKYPAKISKNQWIIMLVNKRIEIQLFAYAAAKDFQDTEELKRFIRLFDLAGMAEVTGPKLKSEELQKFVPKLGGDKPSGKKQAD